jgi:xanthine dehydrogenase YagT iron-sulfur-binding subunit
VVTERPDHTAVRLSVNRRPHGLTVPDDERLLTSLRERLGLTGAKLVCGRGECGACTVLVDGAPRYSCITLTALCDGREVVTIEGLGGPGATHPLQQAFIDHDAVQCGFCTPGQILAASALLTRMPSPNESDIRDAMSGNLCRCGTYPRIVAAIQSISGPVPAGRPEPGEGSPHPGTDG